jgi:hypothetical protein
MNRSPDSDILIVRTCPGSNPGFTARSATAVRTSSAEPTSRISASAAAALFQRAAEIRARGLERRDQTKQHARANRHGQREPKHTPVERDD